MARPGLSAAVGECLGQRGAAHCLRGPCCPPRLPQCPPWAFGAPGRRPRAGSPGTPQTLPQQVLQQLCRASRPRWLAGAARPGGARRLPGPGWPPRASSLRSGRWPGRVQPPPGGRGSWVPTSQVGRPLDSVGDDTCWSDTSRALHLTTRPVKLGTSVRMLWLSSGGFVNVLDVPELGSQPACQTPQPLLTTAWRGSGSQGCIRAGW